MFCGLREYCCARFVIKSRVWWEERLVESGINQKLLVWGCGVFWPNGCKQLFIFLKKRFGQIFNICAPWRQLLSINLGQLLALKGTVSWVWRGPCLMWVNRPLKALLPRRIFNFFMLCPHFFIQIFVLPASLQFTGGFALLWLLAHANAAYVIAVWPPVGCNLNHC
jgi:hypothetical protein